MALNPNHLLTLLELRTWLGIPVATVQPDLDGLIEQCINGASAMVEKYLDRALILATVIKRYDGNNRKTLELGEWPVRSVTTVHESAAWTFDATTLIDPTSYTVDSQGIFLSFKNSSLKNGTQNVQVAFQFGYDSPSVPTIYPLDPIIKQAAFLLSEWLYNHRNDRRIGVTNKSKNGESVSFVEGIPKIITDMLESLRKDFFIPDTRPVPLR